ncbi:hypothetical protein EYF80_042614 [Liparis tanakae]|uniref:Uncharacterized protein n=1 Tax=Liparis tanakae TaxID=230148 RepID=A0A4Z2G0Z8_9TELE|nr:hypothetical protein EYF80_042614 [Liparis tanakae]
MSHSVHRSLLEATAAFPRKPPALCRRSLHPKTELRHETSLLAGQVELQVWLWVTLWAGLRLRCRRWGTSLDTQLQAAQFADTALMERLPVYADDTQLLISLTTDDFTLINSLFSCLEEINIRMAAHFLHLGRTLERLWQSRDQWSPGPMTLSFLQERVATSVAADHHWRSMWRIILSV